MVRLLLQNGYSVVATDLKPSPKIKELNIPFIPANLNTPESLEPLLENVDVVFHPAALFDYLAPLETLRRINVEGTKNLLTAAAKKNAKRFIIWSSLGVYGIPKTLPLTEMSETLPSNDYEISKLEQEKSALALAKSLNLQVTILRPSPIYGPGNRYGLVALPLVIARGQLPLCVTSIRRTFSCVHIQDVVRAALFLSEKEESIGEIYNICDDRAYTHAEYLQYYAQLLGEKVTTLAYVPQCLYDAFFKALYCFFIYKSKKIAPQKPEVDPAMIQYILNHYVVSNAKLKKLGFELQYPDFTVGAWETVQWIKKELL